MRPRNVGISLLEIEFVLKPGKRREFIRSFQGLQGHEGEGHVRSTIFEDSEEPGHLIWIGEWTSRITLDAYMRGDRFGVLLGGIRVLGSVTDCRVIDEATVSVDTSVGASGRKLQERQFTRFDPETFESKPH